MKRSTVLRVFAVLIVFITGTVFTQTINQKLITGIPQANGPIDAYSLKYSPQTGGWVYAYYDTVATKYTIISPKGNSSKQYNYTMTYNALFDGDGNSYVIASENITDTVYRYSILKNNEAIAEYDMIPDGWVIKDNIIYYAAQDAGKYYLISYDTKTGSSQKSKAYDEIRLAYTPDGYSEGEPIGYIGFTSAGKIYYIARSGEETFLVIGDQEEKHYSDISWYDLKFNSMDEPCYFAKSKGKMYEERGNTFLVKGNTEYKTFDWIYGPIVFDNSGNPLYTGQDSIGEYRNRATLMKGNEAIASVNGSIYNYMYTPEGKLTYILSEETTSSKGESVYKSTLVVGDKKSDSKYNSVNNPVFGKGGSMMFVVSDANNKYFVVKNNEVISGKYDYISEAKFMPNGKVAYVGVKYGNYDKKIADKTYVILGDEEFGPYNTINTSDWKTNEIILTDSRGNYAYVAGELTDMSNYTFRYMAISNKGDSKKFDNMSDLKLINGKLYYFAGNMKGKDTYIYDYTLYSDNKKLGDTYSAYTDVNVNPQGVMTFVASKGNDMYYVEVNP